MIIYTQDPETNAIYVRDEGSIHVPYDRNQIQPDVLDEAKTIVYGERTDQYGAPERAFGAIAAIWNVQLQDYLKKPIEPHVAAEMMCGLKLARQSKNHKRDNLVDLAGYAALAQMAADNE